MEKCVLFGAGKIASKIHEKYKEEIVAVIDKSNGSPNSVPAQKDY